MLALALGARPARADEGEDVAPGLRGPRLGITPGVGVGFVGFTGNVPFPSFVFATTLQVEALVEFDRLGFFLRGGFLSAGSSGLWTAPTAALGSQYRLIGDGEERWGFVVRAAFLYERWSAAPPGVGCSVFYFVPNGCQNLVATSAAPGAPIPPAPITADSVGLLGGARLDLPIEPVYLALDAELSGAFDVDQSLPGVAIAGQLVVTFALRDHPIRKKQSPEPRTRFRYERGPGF
jgi:hypothetical protein